MVNKRWAEQAARQFNRNMVLYPESTQKSLSPTNQKLTLDRSVAQASQYLSRKNHNPCGCNK